MEESQFVDTAQGTRIHFRSIIQSSDAASPLIVFLHYWGGSSSTWHKLTSRMSPWSLSTKYTTISIDLRGWGQSTGPTEGSATAEEYSVSPLASDLVTVLEHLTTSEATANLIKTNGIVLVGHSMGAKVALAALEKLSDDMLSLVKGLVLVTPAPPTPLVLPSEMSEQQKHAYDTRESIQWTVENVLSQKEKLTEKDLALLISDSLAGNELAKEGWIMHGMQEDITSGLHRVGSRFHADHLKFSVLAGESDVVEPKDRVEREVVQAIRARGFPVDFTIVKNTKHMIPLEEPEAVSRAIEELLIK